MEEWKYEKIRTELRRRRIEMGLSLRDVEKKTGLSNAFVSQYESGKTDISFKRLMKLTKLLGVIVEFDFPRQVEDITRFTRRIT